ncbi:hypothetical protein HQN89_19045 [Paenibacillus frigoriresistens]|nr:hypothetical protein [Paenibacillus frigoriresistens]NRF93073.1 hypothetical protein [Paenibacillus frigoriresistens]
MNHLNGTYVTLLEGWNDHLITGRQMYKDCQLEREVVEVIKDKLSNLN